MDAKLDKVVSELDEYIALCRKRLDGVLSGLNWTENVTIQDNRTEMLEREDPEDEDDPPLPQSFGCENSVVIGVEQLRAIINDETASIAKKFSDIQLNFTREQKREIYDYVIYNTKKLSEPEVKVAVSNNHQPTTNMTIAQIVAKAKTNAKIQRRKYSTSKPTHIEEVREMLNLQMQALNQLYKPKPEQAHTNTSRKPHLDMLNPFIAPGSGDSYSRSKSCKRGSVSRRPSLDMVIRVGAPSGESANRSKSRDGESPIRRPSLDMINTFRAPSCESASSGGKSQGEGPSESSYHRSQSRSREYLAYGSPQVDRICRSRSRTIESTESVIGAGRHGREQSLHLHRTSISDSVDMLHRMSRRKIQINEGCADRRTRLRAKITTSKKSDRGGADRQSVDLPRTIRGRVDISQRQNGSNQRLTSYQRYGAWNQSKELSPGASICKDGMQLMSDRDSQSNDEAKNRIYPFRAKPDTSSGRATQSQDRGSQCKEKRSKSNIYWSTDLGTDTLNRSGSRRMRNRDKIRQSKSLQPKPERDGHQSDERRGRYKLPKNSTACRRYSQSEDQEQSRDRRRNPTSPCTSRMHRERDLNECRSDLSNAGQDRRSFKQDGRYQGEENSTEKHKMRSSERSKRQSRDKKTRRDKRSHDIGARQQRRDRARGDNHDKRYPSSCSSESSSSNTSSSRSRWKCKGKRSPLDIKRDHKSRIKSIDIRQSHRGSKKSAKRSSRPAVGNAQQTQDNKKHSRSFRSSSKFPTSPQHQASPRMSKSPIKSPAQDEKQQPSLSSSIEKVRKRSRWDSMSASDTRPSSRSSQETSAQRLKDSPTTRPTANDIDEMLKRLHDISKKVAPKTVPDRI